MSPSRTSRWAAGSLLVLVAACVVGDVEWTEEDWQPIYSVAIEEVRGSRADSLVVDVRSRFLVPDGSGELQMGEYNRWGDPSLPAAISEDSRRRRAKSGRNLLATGGCMIGLP